MATNYAFERSGSLCSRRAAGGSTQSLGGLFSLVGNDSTDTTNESVCHHHGIHIRRPGRRASPALVSRTRSFPVGGSVVLWRQRGAVRARWRNCTLGGATDCRIAGWIRLTTGCSGRRMDKVSREFGRSSHQLRCYKLGPLLLSLGLRIPALVPPGISHLDRTGPLR
jgi:hypothetical protein